MKYIKLTYALALALCCTIPLAAQQMPRPQQISQDRGAHVLHIVGKMAEAAQQLCCKHEMTPGTACENSATQLEEHQPCQDTLCASCGAAITDPNQHCQAQGNTCLCSTEQHQQEHEDQEQPSVCPKCGEKLTIDQRYHGEVHTCKTENQEYCIYCGQPIEQADQKCTEGGHCTTHCPECGKDLRNPAHVNAEGTHHCRGKITVTPAEPQK